MSEHYGTGAGRSGPFVPTEDGLPPAWHPFEMSQSAMMRAVGGGEVPQVDVACGACDRWPTHHFHTGHFGSECGCEDCMPVNPVYANDEHMTYEGRISVPRRSPFRRVGRYFRKSRPR